MKKIIVPIDFSYYSENALKTASLYAKRMNSEIIVVHMLEISENNLLVSDTIIKEETERSYEIAENKIEEFLKKEYLKDLQVTPILKHYKVFEEQLCNVVESENADLIIMGLHGAFSFKKVFIVGSNTEKVVRTSNVPVLITQDTAVSKMFKNAVYPCSFSDHEIISYQKIKKLLKTMGCNLKLLYVNTPYTDFLSTDQQNEMILNFLTKAEESEELLKEVVVISDFDIVKGILSYAEHNNPDVVIMPTHGRKGIERFFNGSISEDTVELINIPVITIKN